MVSVASAASYSITLDPGAAAIGGGSATGVFDASGSSIGIGEAFISLGYFSSNPDYATATASEIDSLFVTFDASVALNGTTVGTFTADSTFNASFDDVVTGNLGNFNTQDVYVLISDGVLSAATELLVINTGLTFDNADDLGAGESYDLVANIANAPEFGSNTVTGGVINVPGAGTGLFSAGTSYGLATIAIPEPTSGALLGLAGLALVARRKR